MKKLIFRVQYRAQVGENKISGIEEECSWYLIDQQGNFWEYAPLEYPKPCDMKMYSELIPLIKIGKEYLTVDEIEKKLAGK